MEDEAKPKEEEESSESENEISEQVRGKDWGRNFKPLARWYLWVIKNWKSLSRANYCFIRVQKWVMNKIKKSMGFCHNSR